MKKNGKIENIEETGKMNKKNNCDTMLLAGITLLLLGINAIRLFISSISGDEGFSFMLAKMTIPDMIAATGADVHPPFYYLMIMVFGKLTGYTVLGGRVLSFLALIVAGIAANTYLKKRFGSYAAAIAFALLTFTTNCIDMVVEIRMYTWSMVFVTVTGLFAYELIRAAETWKAVRKGQIGKWVGLTVFGLLAGYTHYYALIMVAFIYVFLFIVLVWYDRKNVIPCVICSIVCVAIYFPWLLVLLKQFGTVSNDYWISDIEVKDWIRYIFGDDRFGRLLRLIMVVAAAICILTKDGLLIQSNLPEKGKAILGRKKGNKTATDRKGIMEASEQSDKAQAYIHVNWDITTLDAKQLFVLMSGITTIGTIALAAVVSYVFRPLYVARYIYSAMGLVTLAFGISFTHCSKKKIYSLLLLVCVFLFGLGSFQKVYSLEKTYGTDSTMAYFKENLQAEDIILTNDQQLSWTVLRYYFPDRVTDQLGYHDLMTEDYRVAWFMNSGSGDLDERITEYENKGLKVTFICEGGIGRYPYALYKIEK